MSRVRIAPYHAECFEGVDALWREVFPDDAPWNRAAVAVPAKRAVQPELFLVALDGHAVVGTAMGGYDGHRGWVYAVAVRPDLRRRGIGARLMARLESALKRLGCPKINLQVRAGNEAVVAFYRRLGYSVEERVSLGKLLEPHQP